MSKIPTIFGISMVSRERRRWLVVLCYAALSLLILLSYTTSSDSARFILVLFAVFAGTCIQFVIFYKLAKDAVLSGQGGGLDLSLNTLWHKSGPDERQVAVRNAAYYKAYRVVAALLSAIIIGPFPELYFGPPYLVDKQHHPVSFFDFCLLPFFASKRFWGRLLKKSAHKRPAIE